MCRSVSEGGRRCACTDYTRNLANQNRSIAKAKRRTIAARATSFGGSELGTAVMELPPSRLSAFLIAADQTRPGTLEEFAHDIGNLPGIHNMVLEDRRDRTSTRGKANNSGKLDQHAIAEVQGAVLEFDKARLDDGEGLSGAARSRLERSIAVREDAIKLGLLDGRTITNDRVKDFTPEQREFYASLNPEDLPALVDVQGRVSRAFWERHLREASFKTEPRKPSDGLKIVDDKGIPKTLSSILTENPGKSVKLAEDLILKRGQDGAIVIEDKFNGTTVSAPGYTRAKDVLARLPRVTGIGLPDKASSMSQRLVDEKFLDPESKVGMNHVKTLRAGAAQAMFASGVPVNNGEDGKAPWQNHNRLAKAGLARPVVSDRTPRFEGYELDGHLRAAEKIKDASFDDAAAAMHIPMTTDKETRSGSPRTAPDARYRGRTSADARKAISRGGFRLRSGGATSPESTAVAAIPVEAFTPLKTPDDMSTLTDRRLGTGAAGLAAQANRLVRSGANPETVGADAHVAKAKLKDAFRTRRAVKSHTPTVINVTAFVPQGWNTDADGDYFSQAFSKGARIDTTGYTVGAVAKSAADTGSLSPNPSKYRVQYISTDHLTDRDGTAVIGDGTGFRVHSVSKDADGTQVVRLVADELAADLASGKASL